MAYVINKIKAGSTTYNIASTAYATCTTAASTAAKVAYISGTSASSGVTLTTGLTVHVKFTYTNTAANPTLSVNGTTAKAIKCYVTTAAGTTTDTSWFAGETVTLTYDGSYWQLNRNIINLSSLVTYLNTLEQTARDLGILDSSGGTSVTPGGGGTSPGGGSTTFSGGWIAISDPSELQEGDIIVITASVAGVIYALSNSGGTSSQQVVQLESPVDGVLSENFDIYGDVEIRLIVHFDENGNIYFELYDAGGQYLYNSSSTNLTLTSDSGAATRWVLTISDGIVLINVFNTTRYLACNGSIWKAYGESSSYIQQNSITIYKWVDGADTPV